MPYRRLLYLALTPTLALGLTCLGPASASADEGGAPKPKRVRIHVVAPKSNDGPAGEGLSSEQRHGKKDPLQTIMRWAMGEMSAHMSGAGTDGDAGGHLQKWFDGGDDVPAAGLRDALKADGWTANTLKQWVSGQVLSNAPRMMQLFSGAAGEGGRMVAPMQRRRQMFASKGSHGRQHDQPGCPLCGSGGRGQAGPGMHPDMHHGMHHGMQHGMRHGMGQRGRRGHGSGRGPRGWRGRGGQGGPRGWGRTHGQGRMGARSPHGHGHERGMQSQTVILWNDGSGWQRQEVPSGEMGPPSMGHGGRRAGPMGPGNQMPGWLRQMMGQHGMGPRSMGQRGMGQHGMGPRGMGPHGMGQRGTGQRGFEGGPNQDGHAAGKQGEMPWMKILEKLGSGEGKPDLHRLREFLKELGVDQRGMGGPKARVRVKVIRPGMAEGAGDSKAKELVIDDVIEEEIEKVIREGHKK